MRMLTRMKATVVLTLGFANIAASTTAQDVLAETPRTEGLAGYHTFLAEDAKLSPPTLFTGDIVGLASMDVAGSTTEEILYYNGDKIWWKDPITLAEGEFSPQPPTLPPSATVGSMESMDLLNGAGVPSRFLFVLIYDATTTVVLYMSPDLGVPWTDITMGFRYTSMTAVDVIGDSTIEDLVLAGMDATGLTRIDVVDLDPASSATAVLPSPVPLNEPLVIASSNGWEESFGNFLRLGARNGRETFIYIRDNGVDPGFWEGPAILHFDVAASTPHPNNAVVNVTATVPEVHPEVLFTDVTATALLDATGAPLGNGGGDPGGDAHGPGVVFADLSSPQDGLPDIYYVRGEIEDPANPGSFLPQDNRLFINQGNGTFMESFGGAATMDGGNGAGALALDIDNDGDRDLLVINFAEENKLYENVGGMFTEMVAVMPTVFGNQAYCFPGDPCFPDDIAPCVANHTLAAAAGDIDRDGDLDLYIANHEVRPKTCLNKGERDVLYCNDFADTGSTSFHDVTLPVLGGVASDSMQAMTITDFNNDLWPDLFFAGKDSGTGGDWVIMNQTTWLADCDVLQLGFLPQQVFIESPGAMGVDAGDFDNDLDLDVFISDLAWSDFYVNAAATPTSLPNLEQQTNGDSSLSPLGAQFWNWGASWFDMDNDGDVDLHVSANLRFMSWLYENEGLGPLGEPLFTDVSWSTGAAVLADSRGSVTGDYDCDGRLDVLTLDRDGGLRLLRNETINTNDWIALEIVGDPNAVGNPFTSTADAVGARIEIKVSQGGVTRRRDIVAGSHSCASTRDYVVHCGLGDVASATIDEVKIYWPSGAAPTTLLNLDVNKRYRVGEDGSFSEVTCP